MVDRERFKQAMKPDADGKFDGVEILSALSGAPRAEIEERWRAIKAQTARTEACPLHELLPTGEAHKRWRCGSCGWEPESGAVLAYEQGLKHGRSHETGGGRG